MAHRMGRKRWEYNLKVNTNASESYIKTQEQRGEREREEERKEVWSLEKETRKGSLCGRIKLNIMSGECLSCSIFRF